MFIEYFDTRQKHFQFMIVLVQRRKKHFFLSAQDSPIHFVTQLLPSVVFRLQNWWFQKNWWCLFTKISIMHTKLNRWQCIYYIVYIRTKILIFCTCNNCFILISLFLSFVNNFHTFLILQKPLYWNRLKPRFARDLTEDWNFFLDNMFCCWKKTDPAKQ